MKSLQEVKRHNLFIKKKRKKHDKIVLTAKIKLSTVKFFIFEALINLFVNHDEFVSINNVVREYNEIKEDIQNPENTVQYTL